jgi:hypothetical protein
MVPVSIIGLERNLPSFEFFAITGAIKLKVTRIFVQIVI